MVLGSAVGAFGQLQGHFMPLQGARRGPHDRRHVLHSYRPTERQWGIVPLDLANNSTVGVITSSHGSAIPTSEGSAVYVLHMADILNLP
jgi:hypothetical protein